MIWNIAFVKPDSRGMFGHASLVLDATPSDGMLLGFDNYIQFKLSMVSIELSPGSVPHFSMLADVDDHGGYDTEAEEDANIQSILTETFAGIPGATYEPVQLKNGA